MKTEFKELDHDEFHNLSKSQKWEYEALYRENKRNTVKEADLQRVDVLNYSIVNNSEPVTRLRDILDDIQEDAEQYLEFRFIRNGEVWGPSVIAIKLSGASGDLIAGLQWRRRPILSDAIVYGFDIKINDVAFRIGSDFVDLTEEEEGKLLKFMGHILISICEQSNGKYSELIEGKKNENIG